MNGRFREIISVVLFGVLFPTILFSFAQRKGVDMVKTTQTTETTVGTTNTANDFQTTCPQEFQLSVVMSDGSIQKMELDTYLAEVVLCEMPVDFDAEALKAQAVVARTYALRRLESGSKHAGAAVCTDSACCQGYISTADYLDSGGKQEQIEKVSLAVSATSGQVLTYQGKLAEATYFSCSGGMTEDAKAVWGAEIPYLQAVASPGEENATHYTDTVMLTKTEFAEKLGSEATGVAEKWVESITYTDGGGVDIIKICGREYKGTEIRKLLGLRSTAFAITVVGDTVIITTKGYGHRVGMSQYGAEAMAVQGSTYKEILDYYYKGTKITQYAF